MFLVLTSLAAAAPTVGLEFVPGQDPLGAQDSSTQVNEIHRLIRPPVNPWVGLDKGPWTWQLGFGAARTLNTRWDAGAAQRYAITALRPSVELQRRWSHGEHLRPDPFLAVGMWGIVPIVRDRSSAYGPAEQAAATESARGVMAQLGGGGIRTGGGLDLPVTDTLSLGAACYWSLWRGQSVDEDAWSTSALGWTELGLRVSLQL